MGGRSPRPAWPSALGGHIGRTEGANTHLSGAAD